MTAAPWRESVATIGRLVGVVTEPVDADPDRPAVLLLNAGLTHRVGPSRLWVRLARALAERGFTVLRYDASVTGDSKVSRPKAAHPSLDELEAEPRLAMDWLRARGGAGRFVLIGLCSGAAGALRTAVADERVAAAVLIGLPPPKGPMGDVVMARHFVRIAFASTFRRRKWASLLRLRFDLGRVVATLLGRLTAGRRPRTGPADPDEVRARLETVCARGAPLLLVHAEGDEGLDSTRMILGQGTLDGLPLEVIPGANHVFTLRSSQERLLAVVLPWMEALPARL